MTLCRASDSGGSDGVGGVSASSAAPEGGEEGPGRDEERESERGRGRRGGESRVADSTDWVSSNLTRRFGLGAGLAWVGVLAFGVISEQIKTRTEVFREEQGTRFSSCLFSRLSPHLHRLHGEGLESLWYLCSSNVRIGVGHINVSMEQGTRRENVGFLLNLQIVFFS